MRALVQQHVNAKLSGMSQPAASKPQPQHLSPCCPFAAGVLYCCLLSWVVCCIVPPADDPPKVKIAQDRPTGEAAVGWGLWDFYDGNTWFRMAVYKYHPNGPKTHKYTVSDEDCDLVAIGLPSNISSAAPGAAATLSPCGTSAPQSGTIQALTASLSAACTLPWAARWHAVH